MFDKYLRLYKTSSHVIHILHNIRQLSTSSMAIIGNYKVNYDTGTTAADKLMGSDPNANNLVLDL